MNFDENDIPLSQSLTRSDERYISQGFASIHKNLDQILSRMDAFDKKMDDNSKRVDRRVEKVEDEVSKLEKTFEARVTRIETYMKGGTMIAGAVITVLSGIIINNWGVLTTPHVPSQVQQK